MSGNIKERSGAEMEGDPGPDHFREHRLLSEGEMTTAREGEREGERGRERERARG